MKKKVICLSYLIILAVSICIKLYFDTDHQGKNLDIWLGEYGYIEREYGENAAVNELVHDIIIWKQERNYYAIIQDEGWGRQAMSLASVQGDNNRISFTFLQTLAWDKLHGGRQRYAEGEVLLQFERRGREIITEWGALQDQSHALTQSEAETRGTYFEQRE